MSADDQRAARNLLDELAESQDEADRLRVELAATRDRRDYLQGQLDIIYDAEYSRNDALKRRIEKLTAELTETRRVGETLDDALGAVLHELAPIPWGIYEDATVARDRWESVRGDAPTQPPAGGVSVPQKPAESPAGDTAAPDPLTWPGVGSAPGTSDRIEAEVKRLWPEHARLHGRRSGVPPVRDGGNTDALVKLAVHVTISMLQRDPSIAGGSAPAKGDDR